MQGSLYRTYETAKKLTYLLPANCYLPLKLGDDDIEFLSKEREFRFLVPENRGNNGYLTIDTSKRAYTYPILSARDIGCHAELF